ncbi:hypothetical protein NIES4072_26240 [Nostoc commune NIES-4072]|uniref:Uncharacterized protein n=1 Tax=Nostoc commune NIES-4072 TaxID=2005467 RepID=A0A2R5FLR5_NOSCO|nr:hypothetical protein NIES4070_00620 [Nostoc commune HK-02]GBG18959.1 hypothetical protein NIES4072_26240 [Nostoc commune NIES-4072]
MLKRDIQGKFALKNDDYREVRSLRLTDDTWKSLGIASECLGLTRADYLEHIVRHNILPSITREDSEFLAPDQGQNEPQPSITRQSEFSLTSDTERERQSVGLPTIRELEILRDGVPARWKRSHYV